jgi:hypothetical protein
MVWEVEVTGEFEAWWDGLTVDQQESLTDRVDLLAERGPDLGRPVVDRITSSRHHNMKELRASQGGALRVLFMFDPRRQVILCSGATRAANGMPGTGQRFRSLTTSTTSTSTSFAMRG